MISVLRILFDLSFYYMFTGFYLSIFLPGWTEMVSSGLGLLLLLASVLLYVIMSRARKLPDESNARTVRKVSPLVIFCSAIPAIVFLFEFSVSQIIQFLPAWFFVCYSLFAGSLGTNVVEFNARFRFSQKLLLLCIPGLMFVTRLYESTQVALPYLMLYLLSAVCLKRILRKEGSLRHSRNTLPVVFVVAASALIAGLQIRQVVVGGLRFVFAAVFQFVASVFIFLFGWLGDLVVRLFGFFAVLLRNEQMVSGQGGEGLTAVAEYETAIWIQIVFAVFILTIVFIGLWFLIRSLIVFFWGKRLKRSADVAYVEQSEWLDEGARLERAKILKPREHRQVVRWYYRKYLSSGSSSGVEFEDSDTSLIVMQKFDKIFPNVQQHSFRDLYLRVRYRDGVVEKEDAEAAAGLWRQMKMNRKLNK